MGQLQTVCTVIGCTLLPSAMFLEPCSACNVAMFLQTCALYLCPYDSLRCPVAVNSGKSVLVLSACPLCPTEQCYVMLIFLVWLAGSLAAALAVICICSTATRWYKTDVRDTRHLVKPCCSTLHARQCPWCCPCLNAYSHNLPIITKLLMRCSYDGVMVCTLFAFLVDMQHGARQSFSMILPDDPVSHAHPACTSPREVGD